MNVVFPGLSSASLADRLSKVSAMTAITEVIGRIYSKNDLGNDQSAAYIMQRCSHITSGVQMSVASLG
jgi:hypothetical protein